PGGRARVRHPRHGLALRERRAEPRLHAGHGRGALLHAARLRAEPAGRPGLRPARSSHRAGAAMTDRTQDQAGEPPPEGPWRRTGRVLRAGRLARAALAFLALSALSSLLAPLLPLPSPMHLDLERGSTPPVPPWEQGFVHGFQPEYWPLPAGDRALVALRAHLFGDLQTASWLGTDSLGRDLLARIVW